MVTTLELGTRVSKGPNAGDKIRVFRKFLLMCSFTSDPLWGSVPLVSEHTAFRGSQLKLFRALPEETGDKLK